ncbi:unnamed protein product [Trichobilharzia regenti]|nr:unnamed protein product [Trichobilharzia regenti]
MDELASSYPQTFSGLRKSEVKLRRKKEIPPPKYLCMPGSLAVIDNIVTSLFRSHVLFGSNEIIRRLENYSQSGANSQIDGKKIFCVFIDSGWLQSQYVHHLVNLCDLLNIRLISVRPSGCLPELVTTKLKEVKKVCVSVNLAVFAFSTSNEAPSDLLDIFRQLDTLFSPCVGNTNISSAKWSTKRKTPSFEVDDRHSDNVSGYFSRSRC